MYYTVPLQKFPDEPQEEEREDRILEAIRWKIEADERKYKGARRKTKDESRRKTLIREHEEKMQENRSTKKRREERKKERDERRKTRQSKTKNEETLQHIKRRSKSEQKNDKEQRKSGSPVWKRGPDTTLNRHERFDPLTSHRNNIIISKRVTRGRSQLSHRDPEVESSAALLHSCWFPMIPVGSRSCSAALLLSRWFPSVPGRTLSVSFAQTLILIGSLSHTRRLFCSAYGLNLTSQEALPRTSPDPTHPAARLLYTPQLSLS